MSTQIHPAVIVGAGPAGLATSQQLQRRGVGHLVLERGPEIAHSWMNLYDSLTLHTGKHMSALPGMPFPASTPLFPPREHFIDYLHRYASTFRLPIQTRAEVTGVTRSGSTWRLSTTQGEIAARCLVMATGIISNPHMPDLAGRGRFRGLVIHSVEYRRPKEFAGQRVLVIGVGNSGSEISSELAREGVEVFLAVRNGAIAVPRQLFGIPIQYYAYFTSRLPRKAQQRLIGIVARVSELIRGPAVLPRPAPSPCPDVPLIGFEMIKAIRRSTIQVKGRVVELTAGGASFADGTHERIDAVILATGYRAAVRILRGLVRLDECGFALREHRVRSMDQPDLYFVGHNYDATGGLFNIARDARLAAGIIAARH